MHVAPNARTHLPVNYTHGNTQLALGAAYMSTSQDQSKANSFFACKTRIRNFPKFESCLQSRASVWSTSYMTFLPRMVCQFNYTLTTAQVSPVPSSNNFAPNTAYAIRRQAHITLNLMGKPSASFRVLKTIWKRRRTKNFPSRAAFKHFCLTTETRHMPQQTKFRLFY